MKILYPLAWLFKTAHENFHAPLDNGPPKSYARQEIKEDGSSNVKSKTLDEKIDTIIQHHYPH